MTAQKKQIIPNIIFIASHINISLSIYMPSARRRPAFLAQSTVKQLCLGYLCFFINRAAPEKKKKSLLKL